MIIHGFEPSDLFDLPVIKQEYVLQEYVLCARVMRAFGDHWQRKEGELTETPLEFLIHNVFYIILNSTLGAGAVDIMEEQMVDHLIQMEALSFVGDMFLETEPEEFCGENTLPPQPTPCQ